jgi:hypothetical protein
MIPAQIITALASHDANVVIEDGQLRLQFPEDRPPPAELIEAARTHKEQLRALLRKDRQTRQDLSDLGEYEKAFAKLQSRCPRLIGPGRWQQVIEDATAFISEWGAQAQAFGWTARELFWPASSA